MLLLRYLSTVCPRPGLRSCHQCSETRRHKLILRCRDLRAAVRRIKHTITLQCVTTRLCPRCSGVSVVDPTQKHLLGSLVGSRSCLSPSGMPVNCACPGAPVRPCVHPKSLPAGELHAVRLLCRQYRPRRSPVFWRRACLCSSSTGHSVHSIAIQPDTLQTVDVSLGDRSYPIYIGQGLLSRSDLLQQHILGKKVLVVTNDTVAPLYLERQVPTSLLL